MNWRHGAAIAALVLLLAALTLALELRGTAADPPPPPQVSRTSMGVGCCGVSYPIWNTSRDRAFDFSELRALGVKFVRLDYVYDKANWQAEAERVSSLASSHDIATTLIVGGWMRYADRPSPSEFETFARETAGKFSAWTSSRS